MRGLLFLLLIAPLCFPFATWARPLPTALLGSTALELPAGLLILPAFLKGDPATRAAIPYTPDPLERAASARPEGYVLQFGNGSERCKAIFPYLHRSPEFLDSMKLRFLARSVRAALLEKGAAAKDRSGLATWSKERIRTPVAVVVDQKLGSGPMMCTMPSAMAMEGPVKEAYGSKFPGDRLFFPSFMTLDDIPGVFDLSAAVENDTLDLLFCHENAHGVMFDMYGDAMDRVRQVSNIGHDSAVISDRGLAYIEGWAECFEALYGPANPLLKLKPEERGKHRLSEFLFGRQDPVRRERYVWAFDKKTGRLKTGNQMLATEGVVAGVFYDLLTCRAIKDPFVKACTVMVHDRPADLAAFLLGWTARFPGDAGTALRVFLENTRYATASNECRRLYYFYYQAKLKFVKKALPEAEFRAAKRAYEDEKERVFARVLARPALLAANTGADLWLELRAGERKGVRLDLNTVDPNALVFFLGLTAEEAMKFDMARSSAGFFADADPLAPLSATLGPARAGELASRHALAPLALDPIRAAR